MTDVLKSQLRSRPSWRGLRVVGGVSAAAVAVLIPTYLGQGLPWAHAVAAALIVVLPGACLGWALWRLLVSRHARLFGSGRRSLGTHAVLATGFSAVWTLAITALAFPVHREAALAFLHQGAIWQFIGGLVMYGAIAGGARTRIVQTRLKEQELAMANAELQALRARLDPHFLFNTLHSLTQLVREDPAATEDALERFGELMRYVLYAGRDANAEVALEEEVDFVRHYLALEQLRLGGRLRVTEAIDPDALELAIPPLLLQPLVENAVRHGLGPCGAGGTIRLEARLVGDRIEMTVADDGAGTDAGTWRHAEGLGLNAVRRQLEARFPNTSEFKVDTRPGAGFTARIRLPAHLHLPAGGHT